jgi:nucleoside-diphosphate-sugar epimerase
MAEVKVLAERAVGALLDDETLRGDLSDDGFNPLLDWATNALTAAAQQVADAPDAEARFRRLNVDATAELARAAARAGARRLVFASSVKAAASSRSSDCAASSSAQYSAR